VISRRKGVNVVKLTEEIKYGFRKCLSSVREGDKIVSLFPIY